MKRYLGERTIDGIVVTVDDSPLPTRTDLKEYSSQGFEWSYEGAESEQLAFAILVEHFGNREEALKHCNNFMLMVVANFNNEWEMTSTDINKALQNIQSRDKGV